MPHWFTEAKQRPLTAGRETQLRYSLHCWVIYHNSLYYVPLSHMPHGAFLSLEISIYFDRSYCTLILFVIHD